MSFEINYIELINEKLMEKRFPDDIQVTLNIPEHKFKKISEKFNHVLKSVYDECINKDIKMFHILLSLQEYFDMQWLVQNVLDNYNGRIIQKEMSEDFNIKCPKTYRKPKIKNAD